MNGDSTANDRSESESTKKQNQPLSAISIQDLNSVQLRRTDNMVTTKTLATRSMSLQCLQSEPYLAAKTNLIAELKMSRDITGIKKLKVERAKSKENTEKVLFTEISRQFSTTAFVDKDLHRYQKKDNTGNIIPPWKRQMLAKKAAEKARKEMEEQLMREAEEKRLQSIPQWKRQLLIKKEEAENRMRTTLYTPKVVDEHKVNKIHDVNECSNQYNIDNEKEDINNNENSKSAEENTNENEQSDEEQSKNYTLEGAT
ncbi:hypothetical protein NQ317_014621 [Molorchus minor]|uniref:Uncharacterized protein n=1 Tax=Molorchus minor TaxID=1323400 RepID=A0ABQ9J373_9CUCU|nr:hypothetical protein NQ317_014621 [Molorchus minor]